MKLNIEYCSIIRIHFDVVIELCNSNCDCFQPFILQPPHQVNGSISDAEPFGAASPGISPSANNNNPDWANNDAFSSAFDGFSSNKLENVSKN